MVIFLFRTIGDALNVMVLSQQLFRFNFCALLFLFSSVANFIAIASGLICRLFTGRSVDSINTGRRLYKLCTFVLNVARPAAFWFILLEVIDRWLLANRNVYYRRMIIVFPHVIYSYEPYSVYHELPNSTYTINGHLID
ncbi:unnamed protein product [Adineta ricciae]|uniref:Uncharacterized protein n=1 Tax=Adineta ricciae TaxID=249248 RepID=A0A816FTX3_ADIRI|nr:unnamed protein product [Adineta ricciae]